MNFIKFFALAFLLVPSFSFAAVGDVKISDNVVASTNTGTPSGTVHRIYCPSDYTLVRFGWQTRVNTGSQSLGFYFNGTHNATTTVTSVNTWYYFTMNIPCTAGYVDMTVISPVNYYSVQTAYTAGASAEVPDVKVENLTTGLYNLYNLTLNKSSSPSSATYVPVNQYVTDLTCVNSTPTTTCAFAYSTTTATTTYDYRTNFDLITLFFGLLLFALGVYMFRSVAIKYL